MIHVGSRSDPSIKNLLIIVVLVLVVAVYAIIALATGDWLWFSANFDETPSSFVIHCYGQTTELSPGSFEFSALTEIVNESISGRKRWDSLSLSEATYQDYRAHPKMKAIEVFYPEPVRIHTGNRFFSSVNNLIIPLEGRHAQTNAVFGRNDGVPAAGSLHLQSTERLTEFLHFQEICPAATPMINE